jgi:tetratricopeptide (TPR) repeat protein
MFAFRPFILILMACVLLACASGPAPERSASDTRLSIRHLNKAADFYIKGCFSKALEQAQEAHERFVAADDLKGAAESLNSMANIYYRMGDPKSAVPIYDETIDLFEQSGDKAGQVRAMASKSAALIAAQRLDEAAAVLDQADAQGVDALAPLCWKTRALLRIEQNDPQAAEALLRDALGRVSAADRALGSDIHYTLGRLLLTTQRPQPAIGHVEAALNIDRSAGAYYSMGIDLAALGDCYDRTGQYAEAVRRYKRSVKILALLGAAQKVQWVLPRLKASAQKAGLVDQSLLATLQWAQQWLAGRQQADICR